MIYLKTSDEIKIMSQAGEIAAAALEEVKNNILPGKSTLQLNDIAEKVIKKLGGEASFKKVHGYKYCVCTTVNEQVVHGLPTNYKLKEGDILGIDLGAYYRGYHSDLAHTFPVGTIAPGTKRFLKLGERALWDALSVAKKGKRVGDISNSIQSIIEGAGFAVVRELVGHGVGKNLHEDPLIPGVGEPGTGPELKVGMTFAVEVIYNQGGKEVELLPDGWTFVTKDREPSGLFERTIAITEKGTKMLTPWPN